MPISRGVHNKKHTAESTLHKCCTGNGKRGACVEIHVHILCVMMDSCLFLCPVILKCYIYMLKTSRVHNYSKRYFILLEYLFYVELFRECAMIKKNK